MVVIVDYGLGNLASIANMGRKAGAELIVSSDPAVIASADKLILPGVGAFDHGMSNLADRGLIPVLQLRVREEKVPILGLCLGVQLFGRGSEKARDRDWAGSLRPARRFELPAASSIKVPHMGWNFIEVAKPATLLENLPAEPRFYFVHSYHLVCDDPSDVMCWTTYGYRFASGIQRANLWERSSIPRRATRSVWP